MRTPEYLSPSSIGLFLKDRELFYKKYLSENEEVREQCRFAQTMPMAIGSSFDAYVKSYLYTKLFGKEKAKDAGYDLVTIFENQVEDRELEVTEQSSSNHETLRSWAWEHGNLLFKLYQDIGCLGDLEQSFIGCVGKPRFEFSIRDTIDIEGTLVPLLGKPDIFYTSEHGKRVILDWKVNGYCNNRLTSPMKGYIKLRESLGNNVIKETMHKDCCAIVVDGIEINVAMKLEDGNKGWADQLSIYSWLLGEPIGSENMIVGIDQICGGPTVTRELGNEVTRELGNEVTRRLRFATHRLKLGAEYQNNLALLIKDIWGKITEEHIFDHLSKEESLARCRLLDDNGGPELW